MRTATPDDVTRMREHLFFEGGDVRRRLSRFWVLLPLAAVIASTGVIGDSTATVIGAMIVAPLMVPILGTVLAVVLADRTNLMRCLGLLVGGAASVVAIGWLMGLTVAAPVVAATNSQVAARVSPRIIDLVAALATGAVGAIAVSRDDIADTLPGVAIAISLVPPLAVVGLTLEAGQTSEALGALLLFLTNVCAILATGLLVMTVFRISHAGGEPKEGERPVNRRHATTAIIVGLVVIAVPLGASSVNIASVRSTEDDVRAVAERWADRHDWDIESVVSGPDGVVITSSGSPPEPETSTLQSGLSAAGVDATAVTIELVPSRKVKLTTGR